MPKKKYGIVLLSLVLLLFGNYVFAVEEVDGREFFQAEEVDIGVALGLKDCISEAFKNSPKIKRKKYQLDLAAANVGIAKSQYFPVISIGAGFYNENNSNSSYYNSHLRNFPTVATSINQLIWNFGKTNSYIKMEKFYKIGAEYEFMDSICSVLFDVKKKYYDVLYAKALIYIAQYNLEINEYFIKLSQNRNNYELETAKINLSDAQVKLIEANNNYKNALINLSNAMYLEDKKDYFITQTKTFYFDDDFFDNPNELARKRFEPKKIDFEFDKAVSIAYENSPELKVLIATKDAMEQSLKYVKKTYMPDLTADLGYGLNKINNENTNNALRVGVNLTSNVNFMELKHSIVAAQAQIDIAQNEIDLYKKDLYFEVKRALNNIQKAQEQVPICKQYIDEGLNNLELIEEQYIQKNIDYTSLQDARKDYIQLLQNYADSIYSYNLALIQLEQAMHSHLSNLHQKSIHAIGYHYDEILENLDSVFECDEKNVHSVKKSKGK